MVGIGALIWSAVRPLLRLAIVSGGGYLITKMDLFPPIAARGAGQIMLLLLYPCLMFSKIVPAFGQENLPALGPLVLVAVIYQILGISSAWLVRHLFWTPHRFRYGILIAGGWGNTGDIPTAVITAVTASAPFAGPKDSGLSVAYISTLMLISMITLFPCGAHTWIAKDFEGPEVENEEMQYAAKMRRRAIFGKATGVFRRRGAKSEDDDAVEKQTKSHEENDAFAPIREETAVSGPDTSSALRQRGGDHFSTVPSSNSKHVAFDLDTTTAAPSTPGPSRICSPAPTDCNRTVSAIPEEKASPTRADEPPRGLSPDSKPLTLKAKILSRIKSFISGLLVPMSISILLSFVISLVPELKGLFVRLNGENFYPPAPDGEPPLAFILDAATFAGAGAVPLGLICLGSALARLKLNWTRVGMQELPLASIGSLAVLKMAVTPVLGVVICQGLTSAGVIDPDDKVLRFVCIFYSCLPTATTQVMLTQVYSGTGEAEHLPAYLIPQYSLMFLSLTALTAYTLHIIF
ncbi:auxin efflux carrier [Pterulicium gracile]|uniref:Auxin efflux carrier n=1 Tax=Pterulicium gracile TaxID=1884261 RepID=A0A5C3QHA4_9AGAR|nr:auxin efflux carrier [Pterula gracilis]